MTKTFRHRQSLKVAVDFDGTIVEHQFPRIGKLMPGALAALRMLQEAGCLLILWTCREDGGGGNTDKVLTEAVEFMRGHGVEFRSINCNHPADEFRHGGGRKIYADIYLDDRNLGGFPGWAAVVKEILGVDLMDEPAEAA